jgi:hypothetical protein
MQTAPGSSPLFEEWGRITRFLESARLAFAREENLWTSLELSDRDDVKISASSPNGRYTVGLPQHVAAVQDEETLFASVLIHSYAFAQSAAGAHLGIDSYACGGIEDWGARLLDGATRSWTDVRGGLAGAVEVAVVRNAFAHGSRTINEQAAKRLAAVGITSRPCGSFVNLTYVHLRGYRARLLSLLTVANIGALPTPAR